jgi:hypothetical protein
VIKHPEGWSGLMDEQIMEIFFFGSQMLSLEYNTVIFSYVRTYIKETARFHSNNS